MRSTTLSLVIAFVHISAVGWGQITLKEKNVPLEKVLSAIEKQTKYVFLYDPEDLKVGPVSINVKNAALEEALGKCFKGLPVEFSVVGNNVLLKRKLLSNVERVVVADVSMTGKVVDESGEPLQGVTVVNERNGRGAETDSAGAFMLSGAKGDVVRFSYVGYKEREMKVGDQSYVGIVLEVNPISPDQVLVIGYGSRKKKDLTGSVAGVDMKNVGSVPFYTVDNALAGRVAGVEVTKTDGTPGGMTRVRIRGASSILGGNDPLYVIDGVPLQVRSNFIAPGYQVASPLANLAGATNNGWGNTAALPAAFVNGLNSLGGLDPDDIESTTILKDASAAAIYGSKAAGGVVIITTRSGRANMPPRVEASWSSTVSTPYRLPKLLNAEQYKTLYLEAVHNAFADDSITGPTYVDDPSYFGTANTNWLKEVTRTTLSNHVGLSISGGGPASRYFSSLNYSNTPGVVNGTGYRRISGKLNLETQAGSKVRFATNLLLGYTDQDLGAGAYGQAILARPDWAPRDSLGNFTDFRSPLIFGPINPSALLTATNNGKTLSLLGSFSGSYAITKDLIFKSTVSLNMQNYNQRNFLPQNIEAYISDPLVYDTTIGSSGMSSNGNSRFADWFLENTLSYNKQLNEKNAVNIVIGQSYESTKYSYFTATASGFPNGNFSNLNAGDTVLSVASDDPPSPQSYLISYYARTNYSYMDKYLLTFTGRVDGSSKFGADNKFAYFPSGAAAWRISREAFLRGVGWLTDLKLRGSYGLTGNQNIGDQTKHTLYRPVNYAGSGAVIPTLLGNRDIRPEITKATDIGFDVSLFTDRLYATFDYYNRQTNNVILTLPVTQSSTYATLTQNAAALRNRGFEASIGGEIIRTRDFKWSAAINATWNRSLVTRLSANADMAQIISLSGFETVGGNASPPAAFGGSNYYGNTTLQEGKPLGLIPGYFITGLIRTQAELEAYKQQLGNAASYSMQLGDPMFTLEPSSVSQGLGEPKNNVILANATPKYFGGMTQEFSYKNVDLQCFFTFSQGGHLLWAQHAASDQFYDYRANAGIAMLDRYTPTNTGSNAPRLDENDVFNFYHPNNLDIFSSSYFKLRTLILSYSIDQAPWMKRASIKNIRLFASATNVFTLTKYPGSDPETSDDPYSVGGGYIDAGTYPAIRTFTLGLKTAF